MSPTEEKIAQRQQQLRLQAQQRLAQANAAKRSAQINELLSGSTGSSQNLAKTAAIPTSRRSPLVMGITLFSLLIALGASAGGVYLYTLLNSSQQELNRVQLIMSQQGDKLQALEKRLAESGDDTNVSVDTLQISVGEQNRKIQEISDIVSKRNRADIDANTAKLNNLSVAVNSTSGVSASDIRALRTQLATLENRVAAVSPSLELSIAQNREGIDMLEVSLNKLRTEVESQKVAPSGVKASYNDLVNMKLEIEDIQIRLDRIQNAVGGA